MWPLMHVEIGPHAMARAVQIVEPFAPQRLASQGIKLRSAHTFGETGQFQLNMTFQHQCVDALLLLGQRTKGYGSRDIRGAVLILSTAVDEHKSAGFNRNISLRRGLIVHDCTVMFVTHDGIKGETAIERLCFSQTCQLLFQRDFGLIPFLNGRNKPLQKPHHGHAITQHGVAKALDFAFVLHGFHHRNG